MEKLYLRRKNLYHTEFGCKVNFSVACLVWSNATVNVRLVLLQVCFVKQHATVLFNDNDIKTPRNQQTFEFADFLVSGDEEDRTLDLTDANHTLSRVVRKTGPKDHSNLHKQGQCLVITVFLPSR